MRIPFQAAIKFALVFYAATIIGTIVWARFVDGNLYSCSDGICGYPIPADLISLSAHDWPLKFVPKITASSNMNDPDTIVDGCSINLLWCLWSLFFIVSIGISIALARKPWPEF